MRKKQHLAAFCGAVLMSVFVSVGTASAQSNVNLPITLDGTRIYVGTTHDPNGVFRTWLCYETSLSSATWVNLSGSDAQIDSNINVNGSYPDETYTFIRTSGTTLPTSTPCYVSGRTWGPVDHSASSYWIDLYANDGDDYAYSDSSSALNYIHGDGNGDSLYVYGSNVGFGEAEADTIVVYSGSGEGGSSDDYIVLSGASTAGSGGDGRDVIYIYGTGGTGLGNAGNDQIFGFTSGENYYGGAGVDCLWDSDTVAYNTLSCGSNTGEQLRSGMTTNIGDCPSSSFVSSCSN